MEIQPIERIYGGDEISLSRNGEYLVYSAFVLNARGAQLKLVHVPNLQTADAALKGYGLKVSPDGTHLYANYSYGPKEPRPPSVVIGKHYLRRMPRTGGPIEILAADIAGAVSISPDSKWIAFLRRPAGETHLFVADMSRDHEAREVHSWPAGSSIGGMAWSPDGTEIALGSWEPGKNKLVSVSVRSGETKDLLALDPGTNEVAFAWLPEGRMVVPRRSNNISQLWFYKLRSEEKTQLTNLDAGLLGSRFAASPDGSTIAAEAFVAPKPPTIWSRLMELANWTAYGNIDILLIRLR